MKYSNKLYQFMRGRYGVDSLYRFLLFLCIGLTIINYFISSRIVSGIELFVFTFALYRVFSKNIDERKKEENRYLRVKNSFTSFFQKRKYYIYRKCWYCHTVLRLPLPDKRGFHSVRCPKCGKKKKIFTFRKEKIEVVRKKVKR